MTWIPDCSQSRAQKNFFSLKGFSEVGTGVMRGSSQECASQYAIRSAAALDTCTLGMIGLRLDYTLHFEYSCSRGCGAFKDYRNLHSMGACLMFVLCVLGGNKIHFYTPFSVHSSFAVNYSPASSLPLCTVQNNDVKFHTLSESEACGCVSHLYPAETGLYLQLLHQLPGLANAHGAVHWGVSFHPVHNSNMSQVIAPSAFHPAHPITISMLQLVRTDMVQVAELALKSNMWQLNLT